MSTIYGAVIAARNAMYDGGTFRARRLQRPVVSIGNISVGGTGKTPFTIMLGELLKKCGVTFDVLSRGYRRTTSGVRVVDPQGPAEKFGDEPVLIARRLQVPVVVGERRIDAGLEAEQRFETQMHLLDDGFQHRQLARDLDIVLVSEEDVRAGLLPFGRLREPLKALRRADVIVVAEEFDSAILGLRADQQVWRVHRGLKLGGAAGRPLVFCGIARPERFFSQVRGLGVEAVGEVALRDHHRYREMDVEKLLVMARQKGADGFVTTAKDEINLGELAAKLRPLTVAEVTMELLEAESAVGFLLKKIIVGTA
jgi:tetraacyldisaccharide 4'-kinase